MWPTLPAKEGAAVHERVGRALGFPLAHIAGIEKVDRVEQLPLGQRSVVDSDDVPRATIERDEDVVPFRKPESRMLSEELELSTGDSPRELGKRPFCGNHLGRVEGASNDERAPCNSLTLREQTRATSSRHVLEHVHRQDDVE